MTRPFFGPSGVNSAEVAPGREGSRWGHAPLARHVVAASLYACWLLGLFFFAWIAGGLLSEGIHALGHEAYRPTLLGQLWGDYTPLPLLLAILLAVTAGLVGGSQLLLQQRRRVTERSRGHPAVVGFLVVFVPVAILSHVLWLSDFVQIPVRAADTSPFAGVWAYLAWMPALLLGVGLLLLLAVTGRPRYGYAFGCVPLALTILLTFLPGVQAARHYYRALPIIFPRPGWVLASVSGLIAIGVLGRWIIRMRWRGLEDWVPLAAGAWAWVVLAIGCGGILVVMHHMCWHDGYVEVQRQSVPVVIAVFVFLWIGIFATQALRYLRSR